MNSSDKSTDRFTNHLTILVFKDNFAARTFRIPLRWISQFGWILSLLALFSVISIGLSVYLFGRPGSSATVYGPSLADNGSSADAEAKVQKLEKKVQELEAARSLTAVNAGSSEPNTNEASPPPIVAPEADLPPGAPLETHPFLFHGLTGQIQAPPTDASQIPIIVTSPRARWEGKMLRVHFNLQYVAKSGGPQQGRIIVLARGPSMMLAHPANLFQKLGHEALIDPNHGEYFSVSRFRETYAEFGPIASRDSINEVEIIIMSQSGQILIHQKIEPQAGGAARNAVSKPVVAAPAAAEEPVAEPTTESAPPASSATTPATAVTPKDSTP